MNSLRGGVTVGRISILPQETPRQTLHLPQLSTARCGSPDHTQLVRFPLILEPKRTLVLASCTPFCICHKQWWGETSSPWSTKDHDCSFPGPRCRVAIKILTRSWRVLTTLSHSAWSAWVSGPRRRKDRTLACALRRPSKNPCQHV